MLTKEFLLQPLFNIEVGEHATNISRSELSKLLSLSDRQFAAVLEFWEEVRVGTTALTILGLLAHDNTETAWRQVIDREFDVSKTASGFFNYEQAQAALAQEYITTKNFVFRRVP